MEKSCFLNKNLKYIDLYFVINVAIKKMYDGLPILYS